MKPPSHFFGIISQVRFGLALAFFTIVPKPLLGCTIFVLTDTNRVLFCNNEDWSNPRTRIWFVPAGDEYFGCAYVGYDDGWARGGLNSEGLACDWVGGFSAEWKPGPSSLCVRGNPTERMLESCATVEDAIAFFIRHPEPDFSRARILVADRTGASVIIGAKDGKLQFAKASQSRGFGFGGQILMKMLANSPEPTVANGSTILRACVQQGQYATKYSNVFDLKSGDIILFPLSRKADEVRFNLTAELSRGGHYYDMPKLRQQLAETPQPLLINMRRFFMDEFPPIPDEEPEVTNHLRATIADAMQGVMRPSDYAAEFWKGIFSGQKAIQADLSRNGDFVSMTLVGHSSEGSRRNYRYRIEFEKVTLLLRYVLDEQNQVALMISEGAEKKPGADLGGD
jgi:hypothetical protein